jgi:uncharacterized membrane protein YphA (DoxX/SURF4 family)
MATTNIGKESKPKGGLQRFLDNHATIMVLRLVLGLLYLLSAIGKIMDLSGSVSAVYNFQILPDALVEPIGYIIPFVELLCALGLLFGVFTRLSAFGIGLMSLVYFVVKLIVLFVQGRSIECGCFGALMETFASVTIWMDIPALLVSLGIIFSNSRHWFAIGGFLPDKWKRELKLVW